MSAVDLLDAYVQSIETAVQAAEVADAVQGRTGGYLVCDELDVADYPAGSLHMGVSVWVGSTTESGVGRRRDSGHSVVDASVVVSCILEVGMHSQRRTKREAYHHDARLQEIVLGINAADLWSAQSRWRSTNYVRLPMKEHIRIDQTYSVRLQARRVAVSA